MTSVAESAAFSTTPLEVVDGIPVFSRRDDYTDNYERIATDHLAEMTRTGHNPFIDEKTWQESERETIRLLRQHVQPGQRLLDVGVGLARVVAHFPELDRYGIDISLDYLRHARERGVNVAYARVEDMPYEPQTFELVLATDILEHVLDLNQALGRMLEVLRPGGLLVIRTPYRESLARYAQPDYPYRFVHLRAFDEYSLELLIDRVFGCELVEWSTAGYSATADYFRMSVPWALGRRALAKAIRVMTDRSSLARRIVLPALFRPIEINAVVRKPAEDPPRVR